MIAVTTFSKTGYETYARRMIDSVLENWPTKLFVYTEFPLSIDSDKVEVMDFFSIPGTQAFYQYIREVPVAHGKIGNGYNYNFDAWKFTRKVFAQYDVLKESHEKVFWLDADCIIKKPVPIEFLEGLFDGKALSYLGREGFYTETGFIGFDPEAEGFDSFLNNYINCLRLGILFKLKRWHDCEAFDWARQESGISGNNLSPWFKIPESKKMTLEELDVVSRSILGEYIHHDKGPRKNKAA